MYQNNSNTLILKSWKLLNWIVLYAKDSSVRIVLIFIIYEFTLHLDNDHFLRFIEKQNLIVSQCILCQQQSSSIQRHAQHLKKIHFEFEDFPQPKKGFSESLHQMKKKIKQIEFDLIKDLNYIQQLDNKDRLYYGSYNGKNYQIIQVQYEFSQSKPNQKQIVSNLVWKQIFTKYLYTQFYSTHQKQDSRYSAYLLTLSIQ